MRIYPGSGRRARIAAVVAAVSVVVALAGTPPASAYTRYEPTLAPTDFTFSPGAGAASGRSVVLWSTGSASAYLQATGALHTLTFLATAQLCDGAPHLQVAVDGQTALTQEVDGTGYYGVRVAWAPGRHKVTFRFLDDHRTATCDRNVLVSDIQLFGPRQDGTDEPIYTFAAAKPQYATVDPVTAGNTTVDRAKLWNDGRVLFRLDSLYGYQGFVRLTATSCGGRRGHVQLTYDGVTVYDAEPRDDVEIVDLPGPFTDGGHPFVLTLTRDSNVAGCDGNVAMTSAKFDGQSED